MEHTKGIVVEVAVGWSEKLGLDAQDLLHRNLHLPQLLIEIRGGELGNVCVRPGMRGHDVTCIV